MIERAHASADEAAHVTGSDVVDEEVAGALALLRRGAPDGMERLIPLVYTELRRMAHRQLAAEPAGHTRSTSDSLASSNAVSSAGSPKPKRRKRSVCRRAPWRAIG